MFPLTSIHLLLFFQNLRIDFWSRQDGEYPKAFIVRAPGSQITAEEAQHFIESRMSKHKWLTAGVYFLDQIPRTPSGKVIRRHLQNLKQGSGAAAPKL